MAIWRALGDVGSAGGTKARQNCIEDVRARAWEFTSNGGGMALQGGDQDLEAPSREGQG